MQESVTIVIFERPAIDVSLDPAIGCAPAIINLRNDPDPPQGLDVRYSWNLGSLSGNGRDFQTEALNAGTFTYSLAIVTDFPNCDVSEVFENGLTVVEPPNTDFTISPQSLFCEAPATITLTNNTTDAISFAWDFGSTEIPNSTAENPGSITYAENGNFDISLTATNEEGCTRTVIQRVTVGPPIAAFEIPDTICVGEEITIDNQSSAGNFNWTITGPTNFNSTERNPSFDFPIEGNYTIMLGVDDPSGICSAEPVSTTIFAQQLDATFDPQPAYGCSEPMSVTFNLNRVSNGAIYNWDFGDDSTSTEAMPVHDYFADNESPYDDNGEFPFTASLEVTNNWGCSAEFEAEIILDIPLARFMPDTITGCAPLTVEFSDSSMSTLPITNFEWIYGDGETQNFSSADAHDYTYEQSGEFDAQLVITNEMGCQDTSYVIRVEVGERITPQFSVDNSTACVGDTIQFLDDTNNPNIDSWHYYTNDDRSSHCSSEANPFFTFENRIGQFDATLVVEFNGCLDSTTITDIVTINGPLAQIDFLMSCDTPNTVQFTSASEGASTITWDFGDMTTGTEVEEAHTYAETGDYIVSLTAEDSGTGCPASVDTDTIRIRNIQAIGEVEMEQCVGQPVNLNSESTVDVDSSCFRGYTWFFDHPSLRPVTTNMPEVGDANPYPDTGEYVIRLVAEDVNGCTDTARFPIIVHEVTVSFEIDREEVCIPQSILIQDLVVTTTAGGIESYEWDFGDGIGMSEEENPGGYTYTAPPVSDRITISLQVEDDAGCPGSAEQTIDFYEPTSQIISGNRNICAGDIVALQATNFMRNGEDRPLSFEWTFGNGESANTQNVEPLFDEGGIFNVTLNYEEIATGCGGTAEVMINVQDIPVADFISTEPICAGSAVFFEENATGLVTNYDWNFFGEGVNINSVDASPSVNFQNPGFVDVTLNVATGNNCMNEITRTIEVLPRPSANFTIATDTDNLCGGNELIVNIIDDVDVSSFSWNFENLPFGENDRMASITIPAGTNNPDALVELITEGGMGCTATFSQTISVISPTISFDVNQSDCRLGATFFNTTPDLSSLNWTFEGGTPGTSTSLDSTSVSYANAGTFAVTLTGTDINGCEGMQTSSIQFQNLPNSMVVIPNAFTPAVSSSTDGVNDLFGIINPLDDLEEGEREDACPPAEDIIRFAIYNRWGTKVHEVANLSIDNQEYKWDGLFNGEVQPPGVYVYFLEVRYEDNMTESFTGNVTLIR